MTLTDIKDMLPHVGDRMRLPVTIPIPGEGNRFGALSCTVTYVNEPHGWFCARFDGSGLTECYKIPLIHRMNLEDKMIQSRTSRREKYHTKPIDYASAGKMKWRGRGYD